MSRVSQHVHIQKLCHISAPVCVVFLSKGRADGGALFLDHLALLCLGPGCPDGPDQLPQSDRSWHSLKKHGDEGHIRAADHVDQPFTHTFSNMFSCELSTLTHGTNAVLCFCAVLVDLFSFLAQKHVIIHSCRCSQQLGIYGKPTGS